MNQSLANIKINDIPYKKVNPKTFLGTNNAANKFYSMPYIHSFSFCQMKTNGVHKEKTERTDHAAPISSFDKHWNSDISIRDKDHNTISASY